MLEYVPATMPTSRASMKSLMTPVPYTKNARKLSIVEHDEDADDHHRVVDARHDDSRGEPQVEAEREVEHDEDDGNGDRVARAVAQLLAGFGPDPLDAKCAFRNDVGPELLLQALDQL